MIKAYGKHIIAKAIFPNKKSVVLTLEVEQPMHFEIVSFGDEVTNLCEGDKVLVFQYGLKNVKYENQDFCILPPENIYAII